MTTKTASRGNFSSTRIRFALAATGAMLCAGFAGGLALHQASTPHRSAGAAALSRPAADTIGGYAEYLRAHPMTQTATGADSVQPVGGLAEALQIQRAAPVSAAPAAERLLGGYAEFLRDRPAMAAVQSQASSVGFAADGRPVGGYAEWLRFQAQ